MKDRIYWIDWLKVFAMLLVVYAHTAGNILTSIIYSFHMPLFFMISGYLHKRRNVKDELKATTRTLIVPYFILAFFFLLIHLDFNLNDYLYAAMISLEQTPDYIRPLWFVFSLAFIRIIASCLHSTRNCIIFSAVTIAYIAILKSCQLIPYDKDIMQFNTTLLSFPFFALGITARETGLVGRLRKTPLYALWLLGIAFTFSAAMNGGVNLFRCKCGNLLWLFYVNATALSLIIFMTFARLRILNRKNSHIELTAKSMIILLAYQFTAIRFFERFIPDGMIIGMLVGQLAVTCAVMGIGYVISKFCWNHFPVLFGK